MPAELAHRHVDVLPVLEVVARRVAVGFDREQQPVLVAELREASGVVLREEVGHYAAEVLEEALAFIHAAHDAAREDGQVGAERVTHARLERLVETLRPVLRGDLVAVHEDVVEAALDGPRKRAEMLA